MANFSIILFLLSVNILSIPKIDKHPSMESSFIMLKPDAVKRRLIGKILERFELKGLQITNMRMLKPTRELLDKHYSEHVEKPWYGEMAEYFASNKVLAMIITGKNAVNESRRIIGATDPQKADIGTIRGDFAMNTGRNLIHGSDSLEAAEKEISLWFGDDTNSDTLHDHNLLYE